MKKYFTLTLAALALLAVSCKKEVAPEVNVPQDEPVATIEKTFTVNAPESGTKTEMNGSAQVVWSEGDQITVIAKTTGNLATFTLTEGAGTASAKFSGKIDASDAEETVFYAFYPASIEIDPFDKNNPLSGGDITVKTDCFPSREIPAVKDGFSAKHAMMVGAIDADGKIAFHFGTAFFKIKISEAGIKSIKFESSGSARFSGRPSWSTTDFQTTNVQSAQNNATLVADTALEKDAIYYIPIQTKQSTVKTLTLTFTATNGYVATASTTSLNSTTLQNGVVYDLKCPPVDFAPVIVSSNVTIDADATSSSIAYEITNARPDGVLTAALKEASDWLTVGTVGDDSVALTATANTGADRSAVVVLTYSYSSQSISKEVTVEQVANGSIVKRTWNFTSDFISTLSVKDSKIYKYSAGTLTEVESANEENVLYFAPNGKEMKSQSSTSSSDKINYHPISYAGGAAYMFFQTKKSGTLSVTATVGKSDSGDCKLRALVDGNKVGDDVDLDLYDKSKDMLNAKVYSWKISNTTGNTQEIQIKKPSGSNSPWIFEVEFVED